MGERRGTKALELWCRRMTEGYSGVRIDNMTTSWRDGLAFCAMVHHFRPDLIEFDKLNKNDIYYNNELAFRTAEIHLGIPALLDAADMESYEVPDRLSILTYLSQYYQTFASQDSPARLNKRPSTVADKGPITKVTGPPAKDEKSLDIMVMQKQMAHVVGVPKREPCQNCGLPVFLAERLTLGKRLFHRTCLKCARCNSQLSPGSFYETEVDGEFCCETCPDEEKEITLQERLEKDGLDGTSVTDGRKSFSEKLAIFQNDGKGLLQKSLSDEEKSKSLKRLNALYSSQGDTGYKKNVALSNFITSQVENDNLQNSPSISITPSDITIEKHENIVNPSDDSSSSDEDTESETSPPMLPITKPPISPTNSGTTNDSTMPSCSSQLSLSNPDSVNNINNSIAPSATLIQNDTINISDRNLTNISVIQKMPLDALNDLSNVTKEDKKIYEDNNDNDSSNSNNSMVRSRLNQFETLFGIDSKRTSKLELGNINKKLEVQDHIDSECPIVSVEVPADDQTSNRMISSEDISDISKYEEHFNVENNLSNHKTSMIDSGIDDSISLIKNIDSDLEADKSSIVPLILEDQIDHTIAIETSETPEKIELEEPKINENIIAIDTVVPEVALETTEIVSEIMEVEMPTPRKRVTISAKETIAVDERPLPTPTKRVTIKNDNVINKEKPEIIARLCIPQETETEVLQIQNVEESPVITLEIINSEETKSSEIYPDNLNPFGDDEEKPEIEQNNKLEQKNLNPFDSSDDEIELEKDTLTKTGVKSNPNKSVSLNPFGSDNEDDEDVEMSRRTPVPTPRKPTATSLNPTPEPTPRLSRTMQKGVTPNHVQDFYGSEASLNSSSTFKSDWRFKNTHIYGSTNSLASSTSSAYTRRKKGRAPLPPTPIQIKLTKDLSTSKENSPCNSTKSSPTPRKKRPAPLPPTSTPKVHNNTHNDAIQSLYVTASTQLNISSNDISNNPEDISTLSEIFDDSSTIDIAVSLPVDNSTSTKDEILEEEYPVAPIRKLIPLEASLINDSETHLEEQTINHGREEVVYRRTIVPLSPESTITDESLVFQNDTQQTNESHARQWQKVKENKESQNKNRQSQVSLPSPNTEADPLYSNKSSFGKWKRRKGPAPALPVPPRKILQMVPLQEIRHELEVIEVQQQGLEKQGVMLEKMIRERCEGNEPPNATDSGPQSLSTAPNSKEVEDLILQLFELVNEKNDLFRRQAELMYLRRQHRLEQEQADIEYEIRLLMAQPERNKTDSDKAREEGLITRLVEVVQLRNEVIDSLEMDRLREAEEDQSIKKRLELHSAKRDLELNQQTPTKLSKKEKKKQKESKKLVKQKKMDADKDADESEVSIEKTKTKKKKRTFLF